MSMNLFMINGEIIFDVNSCELRPLDDHGEIITLNSPTARCLQLLLEKRGEVVSRDNFLEEVWQARGIVVSQNTFYQNISLLRKSLKKSGLSSDIVVTVRSKGFILSSGTRVEILDDSNVRHSAPASHVVSKIQHPALPEFSRSLVQTRKKDSSLGMPRVELKIPKWFISLFIFFTLVELFSLIGSYLRK
ncbi:transcriptional regulator [Enterobacter soli]|uniref:transcriptional regulator n=1 Tax=Enterobacter soli TaxID=885040 RepID=UPI0034CFD59B